MKTYRKALSLLSLALLLALFSGGIAQRAHAQSDPATTEACGTDTDQIQDENGADDASEPQCTEDNTEDAGACVLIGAEAQSATEDSAGGQNESGETNTEDGDQIQEPSYTGSIAVDEAALDGMTEAEQCAALTAQATVTPEEAQAAAEAETGGTVVKVELDNENGVLVYSVELEDGTDVKVDAGNGSILIVEPAGAAGEEAE